jgi:hypothetical protein
LRWQSALDLAYSFRGGPTACLAPATANGSFLTTVDATTMRLSADCTTDAAIFVPDGVALAGRGQRTTGAAGLNRRRADRLGQLPVLHIGIDKRPGRGRTAGLAMRPVAVTALILLLLSALVDIASAQIPARVGTPYTLMDAESRTYIEGGVESPLRGNGPLTGYGYLFFTRPHFLDEDLYLRLVIPPGYFISELIRDHWPSQNSAIGLGISGGLWAESQVEF